MNAQILTGFLNTNFVDTGNLKAFYGFDTYSGRVLFNNLYPSGNQVVSGNLLNVNAELYPAISMGTSDLPVARSVDLNSGNFSSKNLIKISKTVSLDDWTIFLNFEKPGSLPGNNSSVLFSTTPLGNYASGLVVGINNTNRFFVEFKDENLQKTIYTSKNEIHTKQISSFSRFGDSFSLTNYNFFDRENKTEVFDLSGIRDSSEGWFFGNFKTGMVGYTGYSGFIENLVLFSGSQREDVKDKISEVFLLTGYTPERTMQSGITFNAITGVSINPTGITGSGITGYENVFVGQESGINIYQLSGLTGFLTGQIITYTTGANQSSGFQTVNIPETKYHDFYNSRRFASSNILFTKFINPEDEIEVIAREFGPTENLNFIAPVNLGENGFFIPSGYSSGNINVFLDGKALYSGTDFNISNNSSIILSAPITGTETLLYDVVTGAQYVSGFTGHITSFQVANESFSKRDLYLNGLRLISGKDYNQYPPSTTAIVGGLPTGTLLFLPRASGNAKKAFIDGLNYFDISFNLVDEQVWVNGLRQIRNKDYVKTSDNSLLNTGVFITPVSSSLYNNENNFFNI